MVLTLFEDSMFSRIQLFQNIVNLKLFYIFESF